MTESGSYITEFVAGKGPKKIIVLFLYTFLKRSGRLSIKTGTTSSEIEAATFIKYVFKHSIVGRFRGGVLLQNISKTII